MAYPQLQQTECASSALEHDLSTRHGPLMAGEYLRVALGYPSKEAFRQAVARKTVPIPVFGIERRRGKFALTKDVACWLAVQRANAIDHAHTDEERKKTMS